MSTIQFDNENQLGSMNNECLLEQYGELVRLMDLMSDEVGDRLMKNEFTPLEKNTIENNQLVRGNSGNILEHVLEASR